MCLFNLISFVKQKRLRSMLSLGQLFRFSFLALSDMIFSSLFISMFENIILLVDCNFVVQSSGNTSWDAAIFNVGGHLEHRMYFRRNCHEKAAFPRRF